MDKDLGYRYVDAKWKDRKLMIRGEDSGYSIAPTKIEKYAAMKLFDIVWPDGRRSRDFYNIERAKDQAVKYVISELNGTEDTEIE